MVKALNKFDDLNGNKESRIRKESPDELFGKLIGYRSYPSKHSS